MMHVRKSKTGVSLTKNSIVCFVMLVLIVLTTMAWFTFYDTSEALEVYVGSDESDVSISFALPNADGSMPTENSAYFSNLNFENIASLSDTFSQEVTGDGINFIIPSLKQENGSMVVDTAGEWTKAVENQDYLSLTFYVRSPEPNLLLSQNSYLDTGAAPLTATLADGTTDTTTDLSKIENKSAYGDFSLNGIGGAVRVSLLDLTNHTAGTNITIAKNRKLLWIPRPDLKLENINNNYFLKKGVTNDSTLGETLENSYRHAYYDVTDESEFANGKGTGLITNPKFVNTGSVETSVLGSNPDDTPLLAEDFDLGTAGKEVSMIINESTKEAKIFYVYKYTLNMWIEGTDTEAASPLNGGQFRLVLNFKTKTVTPTNEGLVGVAVTPDADGSFFE